MRLVYQIYDWGYFKTFDTFFNTIQFVLEEVIKIENCKFYSRLIQSQLTDSQLFVIFYHCITQPKYERLRELVDELNIVEKIDTTYLIDHSDIRFYPKTFRDEN
jgi:hypothetical protein